MKKRLVAFFLAACLVFSNSLVGDITSVAAENVNNSDLQEDTVDKDEQSNEADSEIQLDENQEVPSEQTDGNTDEEDLTEGEEELQENTDKAITPQQQESNKEPLSDDTYEDDIIDQGELKENSWRYTEGVWTPPIENGISLFSGDAWSFVDGHYVNNRGQVIEGAIAKGIDVSEHNGVIDWEKVKNSDVKFAIIRCGYGQNYTSQDDLYWERNVKECVRLGIPFGVYLYSYAMTPEAAKSEAEHVLRLISGYKLSYPVFYDLENEGGSYNQASLGAEALGDIAETFCNIISGAGYNVGIYANTNWFTNYLTDSRFSRWDKWVAQYNYECTYSGNYSMWQSTSTGSVPGISGNVDLNFDFKYSNSYWHEENGNLYYYQNGIMQTGFKTINGQKYYFGDDGICRKSTWIESDGEKYYAMPDGTLRVGWLSFGSTYYYCGSDAAIVKGLQKIDGLYYYFDEETGVQQARTAGWHTINDKKYYTMPDGGLRVGWLSFGSTYYYCGSDAAIVTGKQNIDGNWYYFNESGVRQKGKWIEDGDNKYYAMPDATLRVGWLSFGSTYYYCGSDAAIVTGKQNIDGNWYYFNENGVRQKGKWIEDGDNKYYAMPDATLRVGWLSFGSTYYYCRSDAAIVTGKQKIDGNWYYFNESGVRQKGKWIEDGDKKYYAMPDGTLRVGWLSFGSTYYYCNNDAEIVTGRYLIDGIWYEFNEEGILQNS